MGGVVAAVVTAALVVVPSSPAAAIQTIAWVAPPASTASPGDTISFSWTGRADTFLGARITGCFANYPDGGNYSRSFGGNFTTGNCNTSRLVTQAGTYSVTTGFTLSTGGTMTMTWNVNVSAPTPTVVTSGNVVTTATSVQGAQATFSAYGSDASYGTYAASCSPASGSTFPPGVTNVTCAATNPAGRTGTSNLSVTVNKASPTIVWSPPAQVVAGRPLGSVLDASVVPSGLPGSMTYVDGAGSPITASSVLTTGNGRVIRATFVPTGQAANAYNTASVTRTVDVVRLPQAVVFGDVPTDASVDDAPFEVTASGTTGGGDVTISAASGSACVVTDHGAGTSGAATVDVTRSGACVLEARQAQTVSYDASPVVQRSVTVVRRTPVISWDPASELTYGAALADLLDASTNAAGTWTYRLDGVMVDGTTVPSAGDDRVLAVVFTPADSDRYTTATATRTLDVHRAPQQLSVAPLADRTYGQAPFEVDATSTGPGSVSVDVTGPCSISGTTVTPTAAGDCEVTVTKAGDADHLPVTVARTVHVAQGLPELAWLQPADLAYGDELGEDELDATVSADVDDTAVAPTGALTYTLDDGSRAAGAVLEPGEHHLHVRWDPTGASVDRWQPVTGVVTVTVAAVLPTLVWEAPDGIVFGTALGDDQLDAATAPAGATGTIDYYLADSVTPARGVVLRPGTQQRLVAHFQPDAAARGRYLPVWGSIVIDVAKAPQAVALGSLTDTTYGNPDILLQGTGGTSGRALAYTATGACTVSGDRLSLVRAGTCSVTASQDGTDDYEAAPSLTRTFSIARANLVVTAPSATRRYGADEVALMPTYSGFVNGDTVADLATPATCSATAGRTSPAGTYAVSCVGASSPDYAVTAAPGHLVVRYGLRGLTWALGAGDGVGRVDDGTRVPVRIHLRDAAQHVLPGSLMSEIGSTCSATMTVGSGDPVCFRYDPKARRLVAVVDTRALARGSVVPVVLEIRATDGTVVRRRTVRIRVH